MRDRVGGVPLPFFKGQLGMADNDWQERCELRVSGRLGLSPTEGRLGALVDYVDESAPSFAARCSIVRSDGTVLDHTAIERLASNRFTFKRAL
jgi:hypothetical protein